VNWSEQKSVLWQGVLARRGKSSKSPSSVGSRHDFEKRVLGALRVSDVRKALQMFVAAPIAPKTEETFKAPKVSTRSPHSPISLSQLTTHQDSPISTSERLCFPLHQLLLLVCSVIVPPFYSNVLVPNHFILSLP